MYDGLDPKRINNTCDTEENGTTTCIKGNPYDIIIGKEKLIIYHFAHLQVILAEKLI